MPARGAAPGHLLLPLLQAAVRDSGDASLKPLTKRIMEFASVTMSEQVRALGRWEGR